MEEIIRIGMATSESVFQLLFFSCCFSAARGERGRAAGAAPGMSVVLVKSEAQQAAQMMMGVREQLVRDRTQLTHANLQDDQVVLRIDRSETWTRPWDPAGAKAPRC